MSNKPTHSTDRHHGSRHQPQRPPIQWPVRGAPPTSADNKRAAQLARQHVQRTYLEEGEPNQPQTEPTGASSSVNQSLETGIHTMRNEPHDWQKYHTAWQQYYHQYFYRYYANWWQQQKRLADQQQPHTEPQAIAYSEPEQTSEKEKVAHELRQKIRTTVGKRAQKVKASSHFKPLLAACSAALLFLFINYNQVLVGAVKQYIAPGDIVTTPVIVEPNTQTKVGPEPKIIIPKIGVEAPVVYDEPNVDEASYQQALERGVVRLGTTANPGTNGNVVIGGHSSNNIFNAGKYKYVFVNLKKLDPGDIFYLNYNGQRYTYKVTSKQIVSPHDTSVLAQTATPTVTLFTCDPPGTNINRLVIQAEQIDPNPNTATANTNQPTVINQENPLPSVAPSLWNRIF